VSRGAVEGAAAIFGRFGGAKYTAAPQPISPAAGRTCPALHCGTDRRRASVGAISTAERSAPRGVRAVPPKPPVLRPPHPKAAAGALVVTFATAARFSRFHIPTPYQAQLVAASARFWRKIGAPRAVRSHPVNCIHPEAGITSHGWEPARGFDDLPHWRGAICFPNDQCRSLPRGATFEAIPGEWRRILVPDGDCAAACSGGKRTMPVFFSGATLPTLLGADRHIVCGCT